MPCDPDGKQPRHRTRCDPQSLHQTSGAWTAESERIDKQRSEDRKAEIDRLERIETDIRAIEDLMFEAFQPSRAD